MATLLAEPTTVTRTETLTEPELEHGSVAHIVARREGDATAQAYTLEARVLGTPPTALCGHVFVPHKNPSSLPVCEPCKNAFEAWADYVESTSGKELPYV